MIPPTLGLEILATIGLYLCGLLLHELGHLKVLRKSFPSAVIVWDGLEFVVGEGWMYRKLNNEEYGKVFYAGLFIGYLPILAGFLIINEWLMIAATIAYLYGGLNDIKALIQLNKRRER